MGTATELGNYAWYSANDSRTHPVKGKAANSLGLYDMSGNVWELFQDVYSQTHAELRGGGWSISASYCSVAIRSTSLSSVTLNGSNEDLGFRVVCP
jgi:formylglycine-generating enzyme required for sulfatase activity